MSEQVNNPSTPKVTVAQFGVGYWGPNLLRNLVVNPHFIVKHVVDQSYERRGFVRSLYPDLEVSDKIDVVLSNPEIDAVVISTPVRSHFELSMKVLESGKHILVEKPMATTEDEIKQIGIIAQKKDLVAMVGHTFIYNPAVQAVKKIINSGKLGKIRYIYSQRVNLGRIRSDVDALWNLAPHDISIVQYWLSGTTPIAIKRTGMAFVQPGIEDVSFLNMEYPGNIMVNIHVSWLDPRKVRRMTVVGSEKMIVYDDLAKNKVTLYDKGIDRMAVLGENMDFDKKESFDYNHRSGNIVVPKILWEEPLQVEIQHFADCILNSIPCFTGIDHAKQVVSILEKAESNLSSAFSMNT